MPAAALTERNVIMKAKLTRLVELTGKVRMSNYFAGKNRLRKKNQAAS